jgi:hypothetical protein
MGLALEHGYDTAFWWIVGIFGAIGGTLLRRGPLVQKRAPSPAPAARLAGHRCVATGHRSTRDWTNSPRDPGRDRAFPRPSRDGT